jgi:hypothetical protein
MKLIIVFRPLFPSNVWPKRAFPIYKKCMLGYMFLFSPKFDLQLKKDTLFLFFSVNIRIGSLEKGREGGGFCGYVYFTIQP